MRNSKLVEWVLKVAAGLAVLLLAWAFKNLWKFFTKWFYKKRHPPACWNPTTEDIEEIESDKPKFF